MADLDITGRVTMDASQAEGAFARVGTQAGQMSNAVAGAAGKASDAVGKIGAGSERGEQTLTRSQSRMRDEILKSTRAIENLGKTASQKLELKIATQGLDPNIYAPYLARLREVEAAQAALRASGREAAAGAEEAGSAFDLLASKLAGFNVSAKGALVGLAAGFSAGAFVGWIKGAIDSADAASKLASSAGLAVEELAGLQLAFEGADAGNQLQSTLSKLASEAQKGNTAFAAMGIAVTNSSGGLKSTRDLLAEVSDKFAGYRDGAEKTALAQQLLGESGAALIPLFNGGIRALDEFDESAKALGLTLSTEAAEAAGNFNDQIDLITQRSQGLARQLASELLPVLSSISEQFGSAAKQGSSFSLIGTGLSVVLETITVVGSDVAFVLRTIARDATLVFSSAVKLATLDFSGIKSGFAAYQAETTDARKALDQFQAAIVTARAVATAGDLDEPWVKRARMEAQQAAEAAKALAPQISAVATARGANRKAIDGETAALKARLAAATSANAAFDDEFKLVEAARLETETRIKTGRELLQTIERETALLGLSNVDREQAIALFALERAGVVAGTEAYEAFAESIREAVNARGDKQALLDAVAATKAAEDQLAQFGLLKSEVQALTLARMEDAREAAALAGEDVANIQKRIEEQKKLVAATRGLEFKEVSKKAADDAAADWKKTADSINSSLTDALMRGFEDGKGFAKNLRDTLVNMFKTLVLRPTISAILAPVAGGLSGTANAAVGGGGGALSNLSSLTNIFGSTSFANAIGAGIANATGTGISGLLATNGAYGTATGAAGSLGASFAAAMPWLLGGVAVAALWKPLFGRKLKDSGVEGTFGGERGFEGNSYEFLKGGLFRSNKTNTNPLDEEVRKGLGDAFSAMRVQVGTFATALGLNTDKIAGFTSAIKVSTHGLSAEDAQKKIQEALAGANNELAKQVLGTFTIVPEQITKTIQTSGWSEGFDAQFETINETISNTSYTASVFARDGEQAIDTLTRLSSSLLTVNAVFDALGTTALTASLASGDLASKLTDAFGGIEAFATATGTYYEAFYSEQERTETGVRQLTTTLAKLGIALPEVGAKDALDQYRALVEAQDINTESGRTAYAALVTLGGGFAQLVGSTQSLSATLTQLKADQASLSADLAEAQGDVAGAAALRYAIETKGLSDAERAAFDYNAALRDQIGVANALTQAIEASTSSQLNSIQKYAAPINATSAATALGPDVMASIAGKSADQIREMALVYVSSLDAQTESGRAAIAAFDKLTPSIDFFIDSAETASSKLLESAGISAEAIADKFRDVILGQTGPEEAGKAISKMVTDGIYNSLADGFTQQITQIMVGQLITPMIQAAVAGTSISAAVSQDAIDNMLTAARNASAVLGQLFADEGFRGVLADISAAIGSATQALVPVVQPIVDLAPAADSAAIAVETLGNSLNSFGDALDLRANLFSSAMFRPAPSLSTQMSFQQPGDLAPGALVPGVNLSDAIDAAVTAAQLRMQQASAELTSRLAYLSTISPTADFGDRGATTIQTLTDAARSNYAGTLSSLSGPINFLVDDFTEFFTSFGTFGAELEATLATANDTAIGKTLNLVDISKYFASIGTEIAAIQNAIGNAAQQIPGSTLAVSAATSGFAGAIGTAATAIGSVINESILAKIPEGIKNSPVLAGVNTSIMSIIGSVGKDDVQGINDSFLLLSGALTRGELTAAQYAAAIGFVTDSFTGAAGSVSTAVATLDDVKVRLASVQTEIARFGMTSFETALLEIQDRADEAAKAFGSMAPEIVALATAERTLLNLRNAATAKATLDGLDMEVSRLDMSPLEKELAGIGDRAAEYVRGLNELGQGTPEALAAVGRWESTMRAAAVATDAAVETSRIEQERLGLQDQLNQLTDTSAQALTRQRDALDLSNRTLFDQVQAATRAKEVEQERLGLQDQLNQLTDTSAQALTRQRDALDLSNRTLFDQVQAATESKKAAEEAAAAAQSLAAANKGWQDQLDTLTGKETERSLALRDATDESTRALMRQVYAQQDLRAAADERSGLTTQLLTEQKKTATLRDMEVAKLNVGNRALQRRIWALQDEAAAQSALDSASEAIRQNFLSAQDKVTQAQQAVTELNTQAAQSMRSFAESIRDFVRTLDTTTVGDGSPESRYSALMADFNSLSGKAKLGDADAIGKITEVAGNLLGASKDYFATGSAFAVDTDMVRKVLEGIAQNASRAGAQAGAEDPMLKAQRDLAAANNELAQAQAIVADSGVSTAKAVTDLLADFREAQEEVTAAQAAYVTWSAADLAASAQDAITQAGIASVVTTTAISTKDVAINTAAVNVTAQASNNHLSNIAANTKSSDSKLLALNTMVEALRVELIALNVKNADLNANVSQLKAKVTDMESTQRLTAAAPTPV